MAPSPERIPVGGPGSSTGGNRAPVSASRRATVPGPGVSSSEPSRVTQIVPSAIAIPLASPGSGVRVDSRLLAGSIW